MASPEPRTRLAMAVATVGGVGLAPFAPGTWGSIPGLGLAWLCGGLGGWPAMLAALIVVVPLGLWAAGVVERRMGFEDPGRVVIDEVAGQLVTLLFHPLNPLTLGVAFVLFRAFDVLKPWPARRLEKLHGGSGIMADDLVAGAYANVALLALRALFPQWFGMP